MGLLGDGPHDAVAELFSTSLGVRFSGATVQEVPNDRAVVNVAFEQSILQVQQDGSVVGKAGRFP